MSHCTGDALRGCSQKIIWRKKHSASGQTMSVSHIQQEARTIDPPFSWPFPMVPSRLHCRSDNRGDGRACSPSMSCCSLSPMWLDSPSPKQRGHRRLFEWDAETSLEDCLHFLKLAMYPQIENTAQFYDVTKLWFVYYSQKLHGEIWRKMVVGGRLEDFRRLGYSENHLVKVKERLQSWLK